MRTYEITNPQLDAALGMPSAEAFQASQALRLTHEPVRALYQANRDAVIWDFRLKIVDVAPPDAEHIVAPYCIVDEAQIVARGIALWLPRPETPETGVE